MGDPPPSTPKGDGRSGDRSASDLRHQLNPNAIPFSPSPGAGPSHLAAVSPEGICFSLPSDSEDEDEELNWLPPCSSPKGKGVAAEGRRRSTSPARGSGGFMADARRSSANPPPLTGRARILRWMRTDFVGWSTSVVLVWRRVPLIALTPVGRCLQIWSEDASIALLTTTLPRAAPSLLVASIVRRWAIPPGTASAPGSSGRHMVVAAPSGGPALAWMRQRHQTSGAKDVRLPLLRLRPLGLLPPAGPTLVCRPSARPR